MSKEIEDEFYCGLNEQVYHEELVITKKRPGGVMPPVYNIAKAQEKLDRISDVEFVRIWQSAISIFGVLEELQDHIGCVFTGTEMLVCINRRANRFRATGVRLTTFTI